MLAYPFELLDGKCMVRMLSIAEFQGLSEKYPEKKHLYTNMNPIRYCKLEFFGSCIQGTMKIPGHGRERDETRMFGFYLWERELLLIEGADFLQELIVKMSESAHRATGPMALLLLLFEMLIDGDVIYLGQQEEKLAGMEEGLLRCLPENFHQTIIACRKEFQEYHVYYEQLVNIGEQMQSQIGIVLEDEERRAWQCYGNRVLRLHDYVETLREYLVQIRELYQSLMDVQQNKVMSILTVVTTIFLPLTLIAGWYGMNFPYMPEFGWEYAYPAVICVSVLIIILEILYFRKKKML